MTDYQSYIDRLQKLREQEDILLQAVGRIKKHRFHPLGRRQKQTLEEAEDRLRSIRDESKRICTMLDELREKENNKMTVKKELLMDEIPQEYNEIIGVCYGKAVLVTESGRILWYDCTGNEWVAHIGDTELDDGTMSDLSELPVGEQKMILSYLIEAGSTPVHYLDLLKEKLKNL